VLRISNENYLIFGGLFHLLIATTYTLICLANYQFEWLDFDYVESVRKVDLVALGTSEQYTPDLTWGIAGYNAIIFLVYLVIWRENEQERKPDFELEIVYVNFVPLGTALGLLFLIDYRNDLALGLTGTLAICSILLINFKKIKLDF
tara:strand:+ start:289 stop:729 length:441 start_codon:yes stop_codon:yes gene_type:complete